MSAGSAQTDHAGERALQRLRREGRNFRGLGGGLLLLR